MSNDNSTDVILAGETYNNALPQSDSNKNRLRVDSLDVVDDNQVNQPSFDDNHSSEFAKDLKKLTENMSTKEVIQGYFSIAIEGDLAGFQIFWFLLSIAFLILKIANFTDTIDQISWAAIFIIPIVNALLTAWFDYIIRKFQSTQSKESLKKARFVVLWLMKIVGAIYVSTYWIWGPNSFMQRYYSDYGEGMYVYDIYI